MTPLYGVSNCWPTIFPAIVETERLLARLLLTYDLRQFSSLAATEAVTKKSSNPQINLPIDLIL
jgi:hypothetical protein